MAENIKLPYSEQIEQIINKPESGLNQAFERRAEQPQRPERIEPRRTESAPMGQVSGRSMPTQSLSAQDLQMKQIEAVLEEDLAEIYFSLNPHDQAVFKHEGEKAAKAIIVAMGDKKTTIQKITDIIRRWLSRLPGINKFFIEQEAKIKADKIVRQYGR